jgi:hypothetical protein
MTIHLRSITLSINYRCGKLDLIETSRRPTFTNSPSDADVLRTSLKGQTDRSQPSMTKATGQRYPMKDLFVFD